MAPQGTYELEAGVEISKRTVVSKLVVVMGIVAVATVGVYCLSAVRPTQRAGSINVQNTELFEGDDLPIYPDCLCASTCGGEADADGLHWCDVGQRHCMGIDYKLATLDADVESDDDCVDGDAPSGKCTAACEYVEGRYDCWNFPCLNGGFCTDGHDAYECHCAFGYKGVNCEANINECILTGDEVVCDEHASCVDEDGRYQCECNPGWEGDGYMEEGTLEEEPYWMDTARSLDGNIQGCQDVDDCNPMPCKNGATCENEVGVLDGFICVCPRTHLNKLAYVGERCEENVDECALGSENDCDLKSTCADTDGAFVCNCNAHWQRYDHVAEDMGGSFDHEGHDNYLDTSDDAVYGSGGGTKGCYDVLDCASDPCQHGGTCTEGPDGCEERQLDGTIVMVNCYECTCAYGWTGDNCERDENECIDSAGGEYNTELNDCSDYALCTNTPGSYECSCNAGWTGDGVDSAFGCIDADDCEFSPCAHGGTCFDCGTLCFSCSCVAGWRGTTCGTDWNECTMGIHQCNNEATCTNTPGSYDCNCDPGFTGDGFGFSTEERVYDVTVGAITTTVHEIKGCKDIDDCVFMADHSLWADTVDRDTGPCVKGGCEDKGPNSYLCTCDAGYTDNNCDMDINECDPVLGGNLCHRFADCRNTVGSYECICKDGFDGNGVTSCSDVSDCTGQCNNGYCTDIGVNDFRCNCDEGYEDRLCDSDINECTTYTHSCARNALCTNTDGGFACACNQGYSGDGQSAGTGCSDVDDCARNPCVEGECTDEGPNAYTCQCDEGFTDFNCDYDINECYLGTHDCHVDARCVNIPGSYLCRCLSGWEGDGFTCTDLDDCDPDPCDPDHGTCEDHGPNTAYCACEPGWGCSDQDCSGECDECEEGTHGCDPNAACANTLGSYTCTCNNHFFGDGTTCSDCTVCGAGWKGVGACEVEDRTCENIDECVLEVDNCNDHATCLDGEGSFMCECNQNGERDEWWGTGIDSQGCTRCTVCQPGYHEVEPCTSTTDRICASNVPDGLYMVESEADDSTMCVALLPDEWYPSRINYGNGDGWCGLAVEEGSDPRQAVRAAGASWKFSQLGANVELPARSDLYTIESMDDGKYKCLFFGNGGKDIYPSLQSCEGYPQGRDCPWYNAGQDYCGFPGPDQLTALINNGQAIWKVTPVKLNEDKFLLQNAANGNTDSENNDLWECLAFEKNGAATNPSRYNWGNGDNFCGAGDWEGLGKEVALLNNKQAVFILTSLD